ncbi:MAG: dTDP-4-dehydro-6-deoxyglucose reductase [Pelotomaculum sp. PtaB.Bin013]|uniref:NAD-dependent epimerase/dehydratase family protein n=1 Tax=Pelotomaculum isophthalicicum JI TaxID=947010 RepID=A0A9X4H379_9FIRM|nr:NAD-dependent epimerase/dehydratase family protein [Pelotomaculum isophthalicicum]MDF9407833.1 NAD-dependent epimerase/dehydratase family protein [Pelotomaculum isophthalicicum JI]OPX80999.1 MAG: dTDP-4-dehydro-6-deoxyglucose reductase [Pelotomaculum sp. PtaB.Bin013]
MKALRCTVLGANGFIGGYLCKELVALTDQVNAFDCVFNNKLLNELAGKIHLYPGDISNDFSLEEVISNTDILFHLAYTTTPSTSDADIIYDITSNLISTIKILIMCVKHKVKKIIFPSSGGTVYGIHSADTAIKEDFATHPISSYGATKVAIEKYLYIFEKKYGLKYIILRLANPYGPKFTGFSQGVIPAFIRYILDGKPLYVWGNGEVIRDYIYIDDVISAFVKSINYQGEERLFNIGSGVGLSINQLINILERCEGKKLTVNYQKPRTCDVPSVYLDISKAKEHLNWFPVVDIENGIRMTYEYMKQYLHVIN